MQQTCSTHRQTVTKLPKIVSCEIFLRQRKPKFAPKSFRNHLARMPESFLERIDFVLDYKIYRRKLCILHAHNNAMLIEISRRLLFAQVSFGGTLRNFFRIQLFCIWTKILHL